MDMNCTIDVEPFALNATWELLNNDDSPNWTVNLLVSASVILIALSSITVILFTVYRHWKMSAKSSHQYTAPITHTAFMSRNDRRKQWNSESPPYQDKCSYSNKNYIHHEFMP